MSLLIEWVNQVIIVALVSDNRLLLLARDLSLTLKALPECDNKLTFCFGREGIAHCLSLIHVFGHTLLFFLSEGAAL